MGNNVNLSVDISSCNGAFDENPASEIARILRAMAESLEQGKEGYFTLRDINGNAVGSGFFETWEME